MAAPLAYVHESVIPAPVEAVFAFHERPDAFELLQAPWDRVEILQPPTGLEVGTRVELRVKVGPFWQRIVAEHVAYERNARFEDVMREGPFAHWHHRHLFLPATGPDGAPACRLRDEISYRPPFGILGRLLDPIAIRPRLRKLFRHRHEVTAREVLRSA